MSDNPANLSKESRRILNDEPFPGSPDDMMNTVTALRARVAKLEEALTSAQHLIRNLGGQHGELLDRIDAALKDTPE